MKSKKIIGYKGDNNGYIFLPYIHMETVIFPEIKFDGYDKDGKPKFKKVK